MLRRVRSCSSFCSLVIVVPPDSCMVEDVGFEPRLLLPKQACSRYTTPSITSDLVRALTFHNLAHLGQQFAVLCRTQLRFNSTHRHNRLKLGWSEWWDSNPHDSKPGDFKSPAAAITPHSDNIGYIRQLKQDSNLHKVSAVTSTYHLLVVGIIGNFFSLDLSVLSIELFNYRNILPLLLSRIAPSGQILSQVRTERERLRNLMQ